MATQVFPQSLPGVSSSSYSIKLTSGVVRTEVDAGYARVRRRFTQTPRDMDVKWKFTMDEFKIFESFFNYDIFGGASWFYIDLFDGSGQSQFVARFKQPYTAGTIAREYMWEVTATLETMSKALPI